MTGEGVVRKVDDMGRVLIPKGMRERYGIKEGDLIEIFDEGDSIVMKKHGRRCVFCHGSDGLVEYKEKFVCKSCISVLNS